jgi:hypothetical protein
MEEGLADHASESSQSAGDAEEQWSETAAFQCAGCGKVSGRVASAFSLHYQYIQNKCMFRQVQEQPLDEPMTVCDVFLLGRVIMTNKYDLRRLI